MAKKKQKQKLPEKKSNTNLIYAVLALIVIAAIIFAMSSGNNESVKKDEHVPSDGTFVKLNKPGTYEPGKVKITEFLKFNCGHCYSLNQEMPNLEKKYGDKVEITYIPMIWRIPTDTPFRKSIEAYILAEERGKGEEMKSALFKAVFVEGKDLSSLIVLEDTGRSVGLDDDFVTALKNGDASGRAEANIRLGEEYQVSYTPTFIINGNLMVDFSPGMGILNANQMINNLDTIIGSLLSQ
ncbi:MAG: DsbA family protein [Candidatus Methanoperedens sp.]|jgi:thiol:disulfide interchange protein DsbA|nr:DsbA family protein [Candidatus Methanoperedens sp.]PKL54474.1 MAG: hypothetical protein CVV36_01695 [Candidatus Methanoperedenaceae archaeon HGW-Methanoperedenaceae-1]